MNSLKKHFIPGPHNDHQPHILRRKAVFLILELILVVEIVFLVQMLYIIPSTNIFSSILSDVLVDLTNSDRQNNDLFALKTNALLEQAAKLKAEDMAANGYFSHTSPSGKTPWEWLDEVGYSFRYAGENLAVNFSDSADVEKAWMNSQSHKKNILNSNFIEIGIGTATGIYKNKEAVFVVQFLGQPAVVKPNAGVAAVGQASFFERILVMPKTMITYVYLFIAGFIFVALILKIVIKIKIQYPKLIFNGIIILFVICSILYFNSLIIGRGYVF